ncbi:hypothetical protein QE152_g25633 [Popillia japonica]|uniref:Uncharacterized protein n=1 Tax=Popillia japonica TaxID=7064 RepID=A0AAW1K1C8_POPJA
MPKDKLPDMQEQVIDTTTLHQQFCCAFLNSGILYVLTTDHKINMYDTIKPQRLKSITTFEGEVNDYVTSADVHISDNSFDALLLLKYKNNILKFYTPKTLMYSRPRRNPVFDCYWTETQPRITLMYSRPRRNPVFDCYWTETQPRITNVTWNNGIIQSKLLFAFQHLEIQSLMLPSAIFHLKYFDKGDILVASGERGDLMVRFGGKNICLITHTEITKHPPEPLVDIFYIEALNSLLTISKDRVIKLWYLSDEPMTVLKGPKYYNVPHTVQMCTMSKDCTFLALTMSNMFDVFFVDLKNGALNLVDFGGAELECELHSCCFSHDNTYLAIGTVDGPIIIYQINSNGTTFNEYARLYSHISAVKYMKFSPHNNNLLVSVGEKIVWWNLNKVPKFYITRNRRSRRNRPSSTELSTLIDNLTISHQMNNKIGSESKPHLLCAIKLKGSYANTIFVSPNFKTFVTKDDEGICYIIEMIE